MKPINIAEALLGEAQIQRYGDRVAVVCGDRSVLYAQLALQVRDSAAALASAGVRHGDRVCLLMRDTPELVGLFIAALRLGAVPIVLSVRASSADLGDATHECMAPLLVHDGSCASLDGYGGQAACVTVAQLVEAADSSRAPGSPDTPEPQDEAFWVFSSGSTGKSKGVIHTHRSLETVTEFHRDQLGITAGSRCFSTARLSFAYALGHGLLAPLHLGATVLLNPDWPTPQSTLALIRREHPEFIFSTPSLYRAWLDGSPAETRGLETAKKLVSAGESFPERLNRRWQARFGSRVLDCYGCSETVFFVFGNRADGAPTDTVGQLTPGARAELRSIEGREPVADGEVGRLLIQHPFLAAGYSRSHRAQSGRFADDWFDTGDLFRRDAGGYWTHCGRDDDLTKVAGQWVNLRELELAASRCDGVAASAGVVLPDGDGMRRIALFVSAETGRSEPLMAEDLVTYLEGQLPPHKRPKWVRVVASMPRTSTGKILKRTLTLDWDGESI